MKKLVFYCQHVLGIGHLIRSLEIARALTGFEVTLLNGGGSIEGLAYPEQIRVVNLPPITSNPDFSELKSSDHPNATEEAFAKRRELILSTITDLKPDVILVELFPFGRLKFAEEILAMIEKGREFDAVAVCSLRDILVTKSLQAEFERQACEVTNQYFSAVLVHSDPAFHCFKETFPSAAMIKVPVHHTGFVTSGVSYDSERDEDLIVVSIGGGRVGGELLYGAAEAFKLLDERIKMVIVTGPYFTDAREEGLQRLVSPRLEILGFTPEFERLLSRAGLSISLAGYNTCMNILNTGTRALLLPFTGHGNQEQTIRAGKLREAGIANILAVEDLAPARLAGRIREALRTPARPNPFMLDGAARTNELLLNIAGGGVDA